jgi:hypothetical protein
MQWLCYKLMALDLSACVYLCVLVAFDLQCMNWCIYTVTTWWLLMRNMLSHTQRYTAHQKMNQPLMGS